MFIDPVMKDSFLQDKYKFKFYWNGKDLYEYSRLKLQSNYNGANYHLMDNNTGKKITVIVLKYRNNQLDILRTFIHEVAHLVFHTDIDLDEFIEEIEAESVAKEVFNKLDIEYTNYDYIESYQKIHKNKYGFEYAIEGVREDLFNELVNMFIRVLKPKIKLIRKLPNEGVSNHKSKVKYTVTCPNCNRIWEYKSKAKIIQAKGEGFFCSYCGEKTTDKLIIKKV